MGLRICITAYHFPIMGRATDHSFLWPIARGLVKSGHEVVILSSRSPISKYEVERDGVKVFYLHESQSDYRHLKLEEAIYRKFVALHSEKKFDLIHCMDRSGIRIGRQKRRFKVKMAFDVEATQMSQIFSILGMAQHNLRSYILNSFAVAYKFLTTYFRYDRSILDFADGVFVTSPQQRLFLERYYLYPDAKTYTVPYGIDLGDLSARALSNDLKSRLNIPENSHVVLTISDMKVPEEIFSLLRAFEKVVIKKPNSYLIIVGDGPGQKAIEYEMLMLALGQKVIMTGYLKEEEVSECVSLADIFVNLSSRSTGFEPAMIEAMAQKKAIIGSEVSPLSNLIEDGQDGFLIRPADTDSLSQLMIEIFSGSLPMSDIGEKARNKVTNIFDPKKMVHYVDEAYQRILNP